MNEKLTVVLVVICFLYVFPTDDESDVENCNEIELTSAQIQRQHFKGSDESLLLFMSFLLSLVLTLI